MNTPDTFFDLFTAYTVIWVLLVGFVLKLQIEQRKISRRLDQFKDTEAKND